MFQGRGRGDGGPLLQQGPGWRAGGHQDHQHQGVTYSTVHEEFHGVTRLRSQVAGGRSQKAVEANTEGLQCLLKKTHCSSTYL